MLKTYEPGEPKMKPDVLKQIAQIEQDREKMMEEEMAKGGQIMLNQPGKPPIPLTINQVAEMLSKQSDQIQIYERRIAELEAMNRELQKILTSKPVFGPEPKPLLGESSKSEPLFQLDSSMVS